MNKEIIIALCAGEASGDLLGAHLIDALKQQYDNIRFVGIGGPRMKAAGLISLEEQEPLSVRGYVEVLGSLSEILKIRRNLVDELKKISPHVFVGIDSPNFNLPVAAKLKAVGIPTLHYVSPSVWAWKPERVHKIVKQVNKVLCLFPMEPKLYREAGGLAEYVGHPLAQILPMENSREAVRERLKLGLTTPVFALLPGSRVSEVEYMTPVFLRAAALILRDLPESLFLMPYPSAAVREKLQVFLKQQEFQHLPIRLQAAKTELACMAADVVLVASGTASLEVALCKRPMVISYKISPLTYSLVKRKIKIPFVGLPNILLNKMVVPELLQNNATPEKLAAATLDWYYHPARAAELEREFMKLHERLKRNTDELAAYQVLTEAGLRLPKPVAEGEDESLYEEVLDNSAQGQSENNTEHVVQNTEVVAVPEPENPVPEPTPAPVENNQLVSSEADLPKSPVFRQPENSLIPPPSIVMGNNNLATTVEPVAKTEPEPPKEPETVVANVASSEHAIQLHELDMSKLKRKSGLFGWLSSVFSGKPSFEETKPQADALMTDASIVAVSRAEDEPQPTGTEGDAAKKSETATRLVIEEEEIQAAPVQMNLPKSTVLPQQNKPNIFTKYMAEQDNQAAAPTTSEMATTPVSSEAVASVAPSIQVTPVQKQPALKVKVQAVMRNQQTEPQLVQAAPVSETQPEVPNVSVPVAPAPDNPPKSTAQVEPAVSAPPAGMLAKYITQASMAWLPDTVKAPAENSNRDEAEEVDVDITDLVNEVKPVVIQPTPVQEEVAVAKEPAEPKISIAPSIKINIAPKKAESVPAPSSTLAEPKVEVSPVVQVVNEPKVSAQSKPIVIEVAPKAASVVDASEPQITVQNAPVQAAPVVEVTRVQSTPTVEVAQVQSTPTVEVAQVQSTPTVEVAQVQSTPTVEVAQVQSTPTVEVAQVQSTPTVEVAQVQATPTVEEVQVPATPVVEVTPVAEVVSTRAASGATVIPAQPAVVETEDVIRAAPAVNTSFASVFRRHTLQTEQADSVDEAHNQPETETEEPAQIVLNRSEFMGSAPTQAAQPEAPSEDGLPAPSVSNYSSNPKRYNSGIFF